MRIYQKLFLFLLLPCLLLVSCGGGGGGEDGGSPNLIDGSGSNGGGSGGGDGTSSGSDSVSYLPQMVYEQFTDFSHSSPAGFVPDWDPAYIESYLINPVDPATLLPITNAQASNYSTVVDDVEISENESFPILQKVIGIESYLRTALVFDISGSTTDVNFGELINEAKDYIALAQASSNPLIANQEFTVWIFADEPDELTSGFTADATAINNALDDVVTQYNSGSLGTGTSIHRAIVEAIGSYVSGTYDFATDGDNDLVDYSSKAGIGLSQMVVFSTGDETMHEFDASKMEQAIKWQAHIKYTGPSTSATEFLYKPVFYYVVGGASVGTTYSPLSELAEDTINLTLVGGEYSFASGLIQNQISAVENRVDPDNSWVYRYAFVPRVGSHTVVFSSNSTSHSYSLTGSVGEPFLIPATGAPSEELTNQLIEIAGPNGEFISNATISFSEAQTFTPATRWVNDTYGASDYSWSISDGTGVTNADGSYAVTSITSSPATLTLTNNTIGGYSTFIRIY